MLEKTFDPKSVEPRLYAAWEASGGFKPIDDPAAEPFSIVIPPPNVTGSLHIGHALNNTLQDVLIRFERMRGKAALWLPGTDHAGIATQMVVERQLAEAGNQSRRDLGREAFVEKIWEWKAKSGGTITNQLKRLGASCDWSRERFTLDEGLSAAVRKVFVTLYKQKLIYRDKRLVNWDPHFQTAISDLEVEQREVDGHYWHFAYPLEDGSGEIVVATTRPETMLGDVAVAVHPTDERYKAMIGRAVRLPIVGRPVPIIADDYADPEKGSGAVKITPAHDFNDFMVGKRNNLPMINIFDDFAKINDNAPAEYRGLDRFAARKKVVEAFEELGLLRGIEKTRHMVPHGDRSGVVVEPYLTDQWYVNAEVLAKPAIKAIEQGDTVFVPQAWEKTYFEWMRNIQPWCISRQLWWGHRIPAWFGPGGKIFVAETEAEAKAQALEHYGREEPLRQDDDVLDTWFSSALWPFSTLGWPEKTDDLARFYPTHTLITGFDIIFFWVARMMMQGIHFMDGQVPFKRIFINALVRDAEGKKMSKSKGNVMDPLELVDDYGADALRFTLTAMSGQARDIKLSRERIEGYRNFGTKLWNATRFTQMNGAARAEGFDPAKVKLPINRWIVGETTRTAKAVTAALDTCGFDAAADALYRFVWRQYCDWYVELSKPVLGKPDEPVADEAARDETRATAAWVLDVILKLLHPVMPFLTEELWGQTQGLGAVRDHKGFLMVAKWPELPDSLIDPLADEQIGLIVETIAEGRSVRAELNVPNSARPPLLVVGATDAQRGVLQDAAPLIMQMLRVAEVKVVDAAPAGAIPYVVEGATLALPVAEFIDVTAERARLSRRWPVSPPTSTAPPRSSPTPTSSPARRRRWSRRTANAWPTPKPPRPSWKARLAAWAPSPEPTLRWRKRRRRLASPRRRGRQDGQGAGTMLRRLTGPWRFFIAGMLALAIAAPPAAAQTSPAAVQGLFLLSDARSREIGPENLTGAPGMGGRTELKDGSAKYAAKGLGRGWKVNPYVVVPAGKTITLGDVKGPGVINHIWMTLGGAADYRSVILRIYWDGEPTPSVEVPAGDFFAAGWGRGFEPVVNSATVAVNPGSGFNSFWQMPFRKQARLTLENRSANRPLTIYYAIDYSETAVPAKAGYFHAQFRMGKADPKTGDYTLLDGVKGQGQYVGTYLRHRAFSPGWWGEGEAKFYIDGDKDFPTIAGTGEEDYFLGSYSYQRKTAQGGRVETSYSSTYAGFLSVQDLPIDADYLKPGDRRYGEYRWHVLDPIRFQRDLKVTIQNLGWKGVTPTRFIGEATYLPLHDDLSSVAYWYQAEPHAPFPALPGDAALNDLSKPPTQ